MYTGLPPVIVTELSL